MVLLSDWMTELSGRIGMLDLWKVDSTVGAKVEDKSVMSTAQIMTRVVEATAKLSNKN